MEITTESSQAPSWTYSITGLPPEGADESILQHINRTLFERPDQMIEMVETGTGHLQTTPDDSYGK